MPQIILLYRLKDGVPAESFEEWTRTTDYPAMRGLDRVAAFTTYRAERNLLSDAAPSVQYVEVFDVPDLDGFVAEDMPGETVQRIMGEFFERAEAPEFLVATAVD